MMTIQKIRYGFNVYGQDCDSMKDGSTIDFEKMIYARHSDIPQQQLNLMEEKGLYFSNILRKTGSITYDQLIEVGITPGTTTIARDELTLCTSLV